ncbi:MAG TPA: phosphatase PAP2 family protein [Steroidobacteraceae bacterium]|nr:phosphatase PAP2 family protein [Steroidobacteraceae bacterium]
MRNVLSIPGWFRVLVLMVAVALGATANAANYLDDTTPELWRIVPPPPPNESAQTRHELDEMLRLQRDRTPKDVDYARANIPIGIQQFAAVLGDESEVKKGMPASVKSLFEAARDDEKKLLDAAKRHFDRPRPIALDSRIQPVLEPIVNLSYPSGHATWVFMTAVLLADMVPERRRAIWDRAEDFAHQRVVGGVHYRSDIDAGRLAGTVVAAYMLANPRYRAAAASATADLRNFLKLPPLSGAPGKAASLDVAPAARESSPAQEPSSDAIAPLDVPLRASASSLAFCCTGIVDLAVPFAM